MFLSKVCTWGISLNALSQHHFIYSLFSQLANDLLIWVCECVCVLNEMRNNVYVFLFRLSYQRNPVSSIFSDSAFFFFYQLTIRIFKIVPVNHVMIM